MALPVTISGVVFPAQNYFLGPFIDENGNVYIPLPESTPSELRMYKATDPTDSFSEVDAAGAPTDDSDLILWAFQDGDTLHIVAALGSTIRYHTFTTSDHGSTPDEWVIIDEVIETVVDASPDVELSCSIVSRSDGTVVVIYNGAEDSVMGNPYARVDYNIRSSGGTWGGPVTLVADEKVAVDWFGSVAVLGASDKTHFFFKNDADNDLEHRSLTSVNSLSAAEDVDTAVRGIAHVCGPGVYFDDGGTERIRVPYVGGGADVALAKVDNDGVPASVTAISNAGIEIANESGIVCFAVDGTTVHLVYSQGSFFDLFHDQADTPQDAADWGTDTEFLDAVTINRISCNVIDRSGKKLAMVYDDGGTIKYHEKDIAVAADFEHPFRRPTSNQVAILMR